MKVLYLDINVHLDIIIYLGIIKYLNIVRHIFEGIKLKKRDAD